MAEPRRLVLVWALGAIAIALTSACSDGQATEPQPLRPTMVASELARASQSVTPATSSWALSATSAQSLVRRFYATISVAARTGDTHLLRSMTARNCTCNAVASFIEESSRDGRITGFTYSMLVVKAEEIRPNLVSVTVVYSVPEVRVLSNTGAVLQRAPRITRRQSVVTLIRQASGWVVDHIDRLPGH